VRRQGGPRFVAGAIVGGLLGAGLGVLLAPRSGEETRRLLTDRTSPTGYDDDPGTPLGTLAGALGAVYERIEQAYQSARLEADQAKARLSREWEQSKQTGSGA
jgi:gas vesicle protein